MLLTEPNQYDEVSCERNSKPLIPSCGEAGQQQVQMVTKNMAGVLHGEGWRGGVSLLGKGCRITKYFQQSSTTTGGRGEGGSKRGEQDPEKKNLGETLNDDG